MIGSVVPPMRTFTSIAQCLPRFVIKNEPKWMHVGA